MTPHELFRRLVAFDTTSADSNLPAVAFLEELFARTTARVERVLSPDGAKANLMITLGPDADAARAGLVLSGHIDCVPATERGWESDPFTLTDRGDRWVGRGASDMKGFLALAADAALRFVERPLTAPLVLLFTYDEEVGTLGAKRFVDTWPRERHLPRATIIGEPTSLRAVRLHKGHMKARIHISGVSAHSGLPHLGVNAIEKAAKVIAELSALRHQLESERTASSEFFGEVPFMPLNVGTVRGGSAINIVPDWCDIELGVRPLPDASIDELIERLRAAVRTHESDGAVEIVSNSPAMQLATDAAVYRELCALLGQSATESVNFATDAGWLQQLGLECVIFGPGSIAVAHRPNEFMPKEEFARAVPILDRMIERFCLESAS